MLRNSETPATTKVTLNHIGSQSANFGSSACNPVDLVVGNSEKVGHLLKRHPAACQCPHPTVLGTRYLGCSLLDRCS